ncbi:hypothetical protein ACFFGV_06870 [Pontibacillus salicampi]|uniref:Uncharacterized protein n=1 Tax=Pontibacillus salicampi TaxID=1449801 RepID=A0ABV6LLZ8_9BACI
MKWIWTTEGALYITLLCTLSVIYIMLTLQAKRQEESEVEAVSDSANVTTYFYHEGQNWYAFVKNEGSGKAVNVRAIIMGSEYFDIPEQEDFILESNEELSLGIFQDPITSIVVRWDDEEKHNKIAKSFHQMKQM